MYILRIDAYLAWLLVVGGVLIFTILILGNLVLIREVWILKRQVRKENRERPVAKAPLLTMPATINPARPGKAVPVAAKSSALPTEVVGSVQPTGTYLVPASGVEITTQPACQPPKQELQLVSPTLFGLFARENPQYWESIEGRKIVHSTWGSCYIERVDPTENEMVIQGKTVDLAYFSDDIFSQLFLPADISGKIAGFQAQHPDSLYRAKVERKSRTQPESERKRQIREFCHQRGIVSLVHFTRVANLNSILQNGLVSRQRLRNLSGIQKPLINDRERLDGHLDAVCLTISFPNYRMFYRLNNHNPEDWAILTLDSSLLWELDCAFFPENAAASDSADTSLSESKEYGALVQMFEDFKNISRASLGIPDHYTTNPQAEVLVFDTIKPRYFKQIIFYSKGAESVWRASVRTPENLLKGLPGTFFEPREDWPVWKTRKGESDYPSNLSEQGMYRS